MSNNKNRKGMTLEDVRAKAARIRQEQGEEMACVYLRHFLRKAYSVIEFMEHRNDPVEKGKKTIASEDFRCPFKTYAKEPQARKREILGHHCQVDDRMKAGAYAYVIVENEETGKLNKIIYAGFGKNLGESLRFLSLVAKWAAEDPAVYADIEGLFNDPNARIHLVQYELDADHQEAFWGNRTDGEHGISHHAEGVLIKEKTRQLRSGQGGLFKTFLHYINGWTDHKRFPAFTFEYYKKVIEAKIASKNCLILTKTDFDRIGTVLKNNAVFKRGYYNCALAKMSFAQGLANNFNELVAELVAINQEKGTTFSPMPERMLIN